MFMTMVMISFDAVQAKMQHIALDMSPIVSLQNGTTENKVEDAGYSIVDSLDSHRSRQESGTVTKPRRSSWGATLLTICVALCVLGGILYVRSSGHDIGGGVGYAVGACIIPFACWLSVLSDGITSPKPQSPRMAGARLSSLSAF